jgi:signal peptidase I
MCGDKKLDSKPTRLSQPGTYHVRFANVDRRLTVWVDSALPFGDGQAYDPPTKKGTKEIIRHPTTYDLEPASIGVRGGAALGVYKLKLWRDTYYLSSHHDYTDNRAAGYDETVAEEVFTEPSRWADDYKLQSYSMYVQPGHYLCLGDNSPSSSDSRVWREGDEERYGGGLVPERLLLGRALAIYYPFYRFGRIE